MNTATRNRITTMIANAQTASECQEIQAQLEALASGAKRKRAEMKAAERQDGLNYKGRGAQKCSFCTNTVNPDDEDFAVTCGACNKLACGDCYLSCKECQELVCFDCSHYCESCEENVCSKCETNECMRCNKETCSDCVFLVGPPQWKCCEGCRDGWVDDGWRSY
ncbi:expressed unknown protein [Seminavis robusta]|uniref:Uncharacterized protein n=1 Tax=Seminavis robusta TaxID=568900 RepID=A0A9N8DDR7_9STRA|nr:expressed unknown protein [Seminavis robusta]|eukprot:Sro72_g039780.1 n/a (165) ;mRNA; f:36761-37255